MSDYYRTVGYQRDKAQLLSALNRIAAALERMVPATDQPSASDIVAYLHALRDEGCTYTEIGEPTDSSLVPVIVLHDGNTCPIHETDA